MGVRGLTTHVAQARFGRLIRIHRGPDREFNKCAIDASSMVQCLMRKRRSRPWGLGSASHPLQELLRRFLVSLLELNLEIVLFTDGAQEQQKEFARSTRYRERGKTSDKYVKSLQSKKIHSNLSPLGSEIAT